MRPTCTLDADALADALRARLNRDGASPWLTRVGFVGVTACDAAGITRRTLDHWDRTGLLKPSLRSATADSDDLQRYSFRDVLTLKVIKRLHDAGISLQQIRAAVQHLQERSADDLTRVTLMSDGASVYECTSNDEVIDLLQGGQGVFGIALGGVWREVEAKLSELTGSASQPAAELAEDVSDESLREDMSTSCGSRDGS
ncbi:MAG: MerR family transcriptional regulator [Nocardioides sp.]|uniref:helix-turn-helix domain-containing protein n=1 Tax=Nocardioides sp. TaxID=35761 RepID=UPI003D6C27BA